MKTANILFFIFWAISVSASRRPNILILMADDLGYGDLGAFGNSTIRTPNIDRLAREGMKLTHHLTPLPICTPSRAAFLTGRYPVRLGMGSDNNVQVIQYIASTSGLPTNETTFAEVAQRAGYRTGYVGKWHVGSHSTDSGDFGRHPLKRGFDFFYGCLHTTVKDYGDGTESIFLSQDPHYRRDVLLTALAGLTVTAALWWIAMVGRRTACAFAALTLIYLVMAQWLPGTWMKFTNSVLHRNLEVVEQPIRFDNLTQRLVWESVEFLEQQERAGPPFLLFVSWFQVHTVLYNSVPQFRGRSAHGPYGDNVEEMDWSVGEVLRALHRLRLAQDTLVLFTSDNGGHVEETDSAGRRAGGHNGPWRGGKTHGGWDGGCRVPTVVRWPGVVPPGSVSDEPTFNMDFFPTVVAAMGQPDRPGLDGVSLLPLLRGQGPPATGERFFFHYCGTRVFAMRWRRPDAVWKLRLAAPRWLPGTERCFFFCPCFGPGTEVLTEPQLFRLDHDPQERRPVDTSASPDLAAVSRRMLKALEEHQRGVDAGVPSQFTSARLSWRPWLQPCCNFPLCRCRDTKWDGGRRH